MEYITLAREGKNEWWRYVLSLFAILVVWLGSSFVLGIGLVLFVMLDSDPNTQLDMLTGRIVGVDPAWLFVILMLSAAALCAGVLIAVRVIHSRPVRSLITPRAGVDWKRFAVGFGFFFLLSALASIAEAVLFPGRYEFAFKPVEFFKFLPLVLILIPIQTIGEELMFRGYLLQGLGLWFRRPFIAAIISSLIFMALHLFNPEVSVDPLLLPAYYFLVGILFSLITLQDRRLELAMGAHTAVNVFTALVANYTVSALNTPSLFMVKTLDAPFGLASFIAMAIVFYVGLFVWRRAPTQ
ncbi:MAG: CPBP family intramembrane metalloprotease [Chloroflexi bacterium]|nr:CPBP family intramembrane metalloprotease [Chloroflexota bacterium]